MIPTRLAVGVYLALALNVIYLLLSLGVSIARPAAMASDLGNALRQEGYEVPYQLIYEQLNASQSSQNQLIYFLLVPSTVVLGLCAYYVSSKLGTRYHHGEEARTQAANRTPDKSRV